MTTIAGIYAHPDDETFGASLAILEMGRRGDKFVLLTATPGDAGKAGPYAPLTPEELGQRRKQELERAGRLLGFSDIRHLNYNDGKLFAVPLGQLTREVAQFINDHQAAVVLTFPEDGIYGHPDHVAIYRAATEAVLSGLCPSVQKLYYTASEELLKQGRLPSVIFEPSAEDWKRKAEALKAHETQIGSVSRVFGDLESPDSAHPALQKEGFVLAWERGRHWPASNETYFTDGLMKPRPSQ
ncbi:PIG-L deacetylase family protein [Paenibacillus senegalensis]|uniref:PIG-L deacetylase family protein n=1 Tax=Paenibacillus senegalensis TaxID=1465766 RepID=UPI0002896EF8|nr:PIG-L family deacetylase [Paenibacillus senegalensis]